MTMNCYFCGDSNCIHEPNYGKGYHFYQCNVCGRYVITESEIMRWQRNKLDRDVVAAYLYHNISLCAEDRDPSYACVISSGDISSTFFEEHPHFHAVSYQTMRTYYPKTIMERTHKALAAIAKKSQFPGDQVEISTNEGMSLLFIRRYGKESETLDDTSINMQYEHIVKHLESNEYASISTDGQGTVYCRLLAKGQEYIEQSIPAEAPFNPLSAAFSSEYLSAQITTMEKAQDENPTEAIGMAKELIESCCKTIMQERAVSYDQAWQFDKLVSETLNLMGLKAKNVDTSEPEIEAVKKMLGSLRTIAESVNHLRNSHGGGHGKPADFQALSPRYAHLAVGSSTTFVRFLWETHKEQIKP